MSLKPLCVELFCDYSTSEIILKAQAVVCRQTIPVESSAVCVVVNTIISLSVGWKFIFGGLSPGGAKEFNLDKSNGILHNICF